MNGCLPAIPDMVSLQEQADSAPGTHFATSDCTNTGFYKAETPATVYFT